MARRRHNARPSRNDRRAIRQAREHIPAPLWDGAAADPFDGEDDDAETAEEAARAEVAAFLASRDAD